MNSLIKYPAARFRKLPERLIYKTKTDYYGTPVDKFIMFSTEKNSKMKATMKCFPEIIERDGRANVPSLYIWQLMSNCSGNGFGTDLLNFAKQYSKRIGCGGRFHLSADTAFTPRRIPHIFYKKYGMNTKSYAVNNKLDSFIKKGKTATWQDFDNIDMYYPPIKFKEDGISGLLHKLFKFGQNILQGNE